VSSFPILHHAAIGIRIDEVAGGVATGTVLNSGIMGERKVVHIDGICLHSSLSTTQMDMQQVSDFAINYGVDFVATSQVSGPSDIEDLRSFLDNNGCEKTRIIAKIETAKGLKNLEEIIEEADGIMIARGNLGLDIGPEKVALAQCKIITKCKVGFIHSSSYM
jgi:pyruvate kinase